MRVLQLSALPLTMSVAHGLLIPYVLTVINVQLNWTAEDTAVTRELRERTSDQTVSVTLQLMMSIINYYHLPAGFCLQLCIFEPSAHDTAVKRTVKVKDKSTL